MKYYTAIVCSLLLLACQPKKPFGGPLAIATTPRITDSACMTRACPDVYDPVCVTYENNGRRMQQTFSNQCQVCIAAEYIVSTRHGSCDN
ncbi:MAG: alkaline protease [Cardiobacteriaceae bacterium]|nr:alkaline protease [Cardiobacteriaceae bacterium]